MVVVGVLGCWVGGGKAAGFGTIGVMKTKLVLAACFALAAGSAAAGDFPLCMYGVSAKRDLAAIKEAGFNCFLAYTQEPAALAELAAEAKKLKLKMAAYPDRVIDSPYSEKAKSWPILAWYLYDEPEVHGLPPAELEKLNLKTKTWSPGQRTAFVVGDGAAALTYGAAADALMVDWYPVPHLKLESVGHHISLARSAAKIMDAKNPAKPVWAVLQAFDWKIYPQRHEPKRIGRFPTFAEIRFMTYLAIVRGAEGLFYFTFTQEGKTLDATPERWFMFKKMAAEINALRPMLEKGKDAEPPAGLDARLAVRVLSKGGGRRLLLLLNPSAAEIPVDAEILKGWRPLFEGKRRLEEILPGGKDLRLPPYRTLVLEKD